MWAPEMSKNGPEMVMWPKKSVSTEGAIPSNF